MNRRFMLLILFLCTIASATAVLGANAARSGGNIQAHMVPIASRNLPLLETGPETPSDIGGKSNTSQTALDFYQSPGIELGTTSCDIQHYMRMARQVAVGADGRVHFVWTAAPLPFDAGLRAVWYTSYNPATGVFAPEAFSVSDLMSKTPGRFCTVDVAVSPGGAQNRALVVNHYGSGPATTSALDIVSGGGAFTAVDPPSTVVNREGILTGGATTFTNNYVWPVVAADKDGAGRLVIHIAAMEGKTASGSWKAITYFRGQSSGITMDPGMYGTAGMFVDSCQAIGYDIAASPYNNDVVIAYPRAREANSENNDLAYRRSTDMGETWGPMVNITNYATEVQERCAGDLSVLFTADGNFHILFVANIYDSVAGTVSDQQCKLKHWSSMNPSSTSTVLEANNQDDNCYTPAFEYNVSKVTLTQCYSTSLGRDLLYAVYSRQLGTTTDPDCSLLGYFNQEVFISPSSTWGETWGAPVNLTNTQTNDCVAGACADDGSSSSARYTVDSLRIEYMEDLDAGSSVANDGGTSTLNPVMFISYPCIDMAPYRILTCSPSAIGYPFHANPGSTATQDLLLVNGGNQPIAWTSSIIDGGEGWISVPGSGTVQAGYTNSAIITATVGPISLEGLYRGTIRFTYDGGIKTLDVPVEFYTFDRWFLPEDVAIRTANNRMMVNQAGQAADDVSGSSFSYFVTGGEDFITDASLIIGNSADNLSWLIYDKGQGDPTPENNFGRLYALSNTTIDSTTFSSYRVASGSGTNRDSTIGFDVRWYAAKHVDSADFYIGHFEVYKGTNNPAGTVTGLDIAFACDWDVPSDTSFNNSIGTDPTRQMIYLQGEYSADRQQGFAALAAYCEDGQNLVPIVGGFAWGNNQQVHPRRGYQVDSAWKYMQATTSYNSLWSQGDSIGDMSIVMVIAKNYTVTSTIRLKFDIVLAAKRAQNNWDGLAGLNTAVDKGKAFITKHVALGCTSCGDANSDGRISVADMAFLVCYVYSGGPAPGECNYPKGKGDANGDGSVNIEDIGHLIHYIFSGGSAPHCMGVYHE